MYKYGVRLNVNATGNISVMFDTNKNIDLKQKNQTKTLQYYGSFLGSQSAEVKALVVEGYYFFITQVYC